MSPLGLCLPAHSKLRWQPVLTSQCQSHSLVQPHQPLWLLYPLPTLSQLYLQRVSIYFQTNCAWEPATCGPAAGPGTSAQPGAVQCSLGSLLPKKAPTLTPTQATQRPPRTGLTGGSALLYCKITVSSCFFFFSLALLIPPGSGSLL